MKLRFKTVSVAVSGDYFQIMFDDDLDEDGEPYFLIQRQFEFPDDGTCYFESHHEDLIANCEVRYASLSTNTLLLSYGQDAKRRDVEILFGLGGTDYQDLVSTLKEMIPGVRIEADRMPSFPNDR